MKEDIMEEEGKPVHNTIYDGIFPSVILRK